MKWIIAKNYDELSKISAEIFIDQLQKKPNSVIGLATGSTPIGFYKELVKRYNAGEISFEKVTSFNLDEYIGLTKESEVSFRYFMYDNLFSKVNIAAENVNIPSGEAATIEQTCVNYEKAIDEAGGIDIQLLGIGMNGHIGFNEPGTSFHSVTQVVELTESTRNANKIHFSNPEDVPTHAITMGISSILKSKKVVLLINGKDKQKAYEFLRSGEISESFPASALHMHKDVTVIYSEISELQN